MKTYFDVTETFKGEIPFEYFSHHADSNSCGVSLQIGVEYLVYAPDTGRIGMCSGIVAISVTPEHGEAMGPKYVSALRAFKAGENDNLAEPWHFDQYQGVCNLTGSFLYGETSWQASISVTYRAAPLEVIVQDPDAPRFQPGYAELSVSVPGREDLEGFPLSMQIDEDEYTALWSMGAYNRGRYLLGPASILEFLNGLEQVDTLYLKSSHPTHGSIDAKASLVNAGESVSKMLECINSHRLQ